MAAGPATALERELSLPKSAAARSKMLTLEMAKGAKNKIMSSMFRIENLPHELGARMHAELVRDGWQCRSSARWGTRTGSGTCT